MNFYTFSFRERKFKVLVTMKLTLLLIVLCSFNLSASVFAQQITLNERNAPLSKLFKEIEKQSGYTIVYEDNLLKQANPVTIIIRKASLSTVLDRCLEKQSLTYSIVENTVIVKLKPKGIIDKVKEFFKMPVKVAGKVTDTTGVPLPGASIHIKGNEASYTSNSNGEFSFEAEPGDEVTISFVGYTPHVITVAEGMAFQNVVLHQENNSLHEVVVVSTGYQTLSKEKATGSFVLVDNNLLNRSVSTNILDRLDGVTSGLVFSVNRTTELGRNSALTIRGRNTLFANADPLIVIDNFPYEGDLNNINPNDIETITVLKDAAAAAQWGARSGNGVIIITTKKGALNSIPKVGFSINTTIGQKPDLYYAPQLTSSQYIEAEQFLFNNGAYNTGINAGYTAITPAVEIFLARRNGTISSADSAARINTLKSFDYRDELSKHYYRSSINQQYQGSINGGGNNQKYFVSAGYDKNLNSKIGDDYSRTTLNASNTYYLLKNKLELFTNIIYTASKTNSTSLFISPTPYTQVADANGNSLPVANILSLNYIKSAGNGQLLDWYYRPLDELKNRYSSPETSLTDYRANLSLSYKIFNGLKASALYSYEKSLTETQTLNELESYYTRNLINIYSQISSSGVVTYPVPLGGILDLNNTTLRQKSGRFQLSYDNSWGDHGFGGIAGYEIRSVEADNLATRFYGYNPDTRTNQNNAINFNTIYPLFYGSSTSTIGTFSRQGSSSNHFISYYANGTYSYRGKYLASLSVRRDESNIFGVATNQKGVPLWSTGLAWYVSREGFYKVDWLPELKMRATYGYTGNVSNSLSAYLTIQSIGSINSYNVPYSSIVNPPNPSLRWERITNVNLGLDFASKDNRISGSVDVWRKKGVDLIGNSPIAPQTGIIIYTGNSAASVAKGLDVQLNSININGSLKWYTTLLYNYNTSRVTDYKALNGTNLSVVSATYNNPLQGYPYLSVFSFKYAGLDNQGNPLGYLDGEISNNYSGITNSINREDLVYNGPATPTSFGSLRNTFLYKGFDLSFIVSYKLGYYFRRVSLRNGALYATTSGGGGFEDNTDYEKRWQKPGDEQTTNVPSLLYPASNARDNLYRYSSALVEKADNIRLQDIRLGYTFHKSHWLPFQKLNVFAYLNNLGIIWRANKYKIDPDYPADIPSARTIAFGLRADL